MRYISAKPHSLGESWRNKQKKKHLENNVHQLRQQVSKHQYHKRKRLNLEDKQVQLNNNLLKNHKPYTSFSRLTQDTYAHF